MLSSTAYVMAYCDTPLCDVSEQFDIHAIGRHYSENALKGDMQRAGWEWIDDNTHYCPSCVEEIIANEKACDALIMEGREALQGE